MQKIESPTEGLPFRDLPDWAAVTKSQIVSVLPISESTLDAMIKQNAFPKGQQLIGRTLFWRLSAVRDAMEKLFNGEFEGLKLWEEKKSRKT